MSYDIEYDFYTNYELSLEKKFYVKKGLSGLINTGNKCYSNSVLHCLMHNLTLTDYLLSNKFKMDSIECNFKSKNEYKVIISYIQLLLSNWNFNELKNPTIFNNTITTFLVKYNNNYQHDSYEYLLDILDLFHKALSYKINVNISGEVKTDTDYLMKESILYWKKNYENNY